MSRAEKRIENAGKEFKKFVESIDDFTLLSEYKGSKINVLIKHEECGCEFLVKPYNFYKGNRCPNCKNKRIANSLKLSYEEVKKRIEKENYTLLSKNYVNSREKIRVKHNECGHEYEVSFNNFNRGKRCPKCANIKRSKFLKGSLESKASTIIENFLIENKISYKKEYKFNNLISSKNYYLRFDFAIFKNDKLLFLLEYDGEQHFKSWKSSYYDDEKLKRLQENDKLKDEYCINNNITLYRIDFNSYINNTIISDVKTILNEENYWSSTTIETTDDNLEGSRVEPSGSGVS